MPPCCCYGTDENQVSPESDDDLKDTAVHQKSGDGDEEITKDRSCTDVFFLVVFAVFLVVMFVLLGYCMSMGDIYRIVNGYDDCGNVCGRVNSFYDAATGCKGLDLTERKYLRVLSEGLDSTDPGSVNRICMIACPENDLYSGVVSNRCLPDKYLQSNTYVPKTGLVEFYQEVGEDLNSCWREIVYLCLIALAFSALTLLLFRYTIRFIVWLVLIGVIVVCVVGTICLWIQYSVEAQTDYRDSIGKRRRTSYLVFSIVATFVTVIVCVVIVVLRKRIALVIALFREAGKACASMPLLLVEPILTFVALGLLIGLWLYFALWIESAGELTIENGTSAKYVKNPAILVTRWYSVLTLFWMSQFIIGCQHMIVAGAVASWFFTRNKSALGWPIARSFRNLLRYHLGTVALGALIIALLKLVRLVFRAAELALNNPQNSITQVLWTACQCCLGCIEQTVQYLTRNAYIETAITGQPFCVAGRRAAETLAGNALRVFAINSVGDFVLLLGKAFVVAVTVLIGIELIQKKENVHHSWVPLVLAGLFAFFIVHCFVSVYEMTIDTIFLCFCEDCDRNDGISKPYYMSRSLMQFVQNSKKALLTAEQQPPAGSGKAWSTERTDPIRNDSPR